MQSDQGKFMAGEAADPALVSPLAADRRSAVLAAVRDAARTRILPRFRALEAGEVAAKSGPQDLVTVADTEAEADIIAALRLSWPEAVVLGEETVAADPARRAEMGTARTCVVVDPVDGTWNFAKGLAVFGVLVVVLHQGTPVWGLLYDPVLDDWIEASAGEATLFHRLGRARPLATSSETRPGHMSGFLPPSLFRRDHRSRVIAAADRFQRVSSLRCALFEYRLLAAGQVDFVLTGPTLHPWDHAAGVLAVQGAGGVARFLDGERYHAGRARGVILSAGSEAAWAAVAERFSFLAAIRD